MSTMWKYHPPSPMTRPMPTIVPVATSMTWAPHHDPAAAAVVCSSVAADSPASWRSRTASAPDTAPSTSS